MDFGGVRFAGWTPAETLSALRRREEEEDAEDDRQHMSEVRVRTLEEIKAAKAAEAAQSSAQGSSTAPSSSSAQKPPPAPSPPVKKYGQWKAGLEAVLSAARAGKTDRVRQLLAEHASLRLDHADADHVG